MVSLRRGALFAVPLWVVFCGLARAEEKSGRILERLDGPTRAKLLMALLALVIIGLALIALAMWGGRYVRRIGRDAEPSDAAIGKNWHQKPLNDPTADANGADVEE